MLEASANRILERLGSDDVVLDIGGWGRPFNRADWVIDLMPYETRGEFGHDGPAEERFSADTWIQRDVCDREPFPFEDKQLDFVICSQTLEDLRDPVFVCSEMVRIAKAGYIEVPSRLEEQSLGVQGRWAGWGHHRWLIDVHDDRIEFVFKHHIVHGRRRNHFRHGFGERLPSERRVQALWWEGSFEYGERVFIGPEEIDPYLSDFVARHKDEVKVPLWFPLRRARRRLRRAALERG